MKVSVIIPVYNVEKYIDRCIQSVIKQSYKNIEIILIDDGSIDNSGKICDDYATLDDRVSVIHKKNGGLSSARNIGIEKSEGDAIFFLDSDDYLSIKCIERMVMLMKTYMADISIIQMKYVSEDTNEESNDIKNEKITIMDSEHAIEESLYQKIYTCCAPAKLYKRSTISNIRFPLGRISEDLATCHLFLNNANNIVYSNYYGYYYRQHELSIMHTFNPRRMDALVWAKEIEKYCNDNYPKILNAAYCRTFNVSVHLLLDLPAKGIEHDNYCNILWNEIKRTRIITLIDKKVRKREKAAAILSFFGEKMMRAVWRSKLAVKQ